MSENTASQSPPPASLADTATALEAFITATTDALAAAGAPAAAREAVTETGTELVETLTTHADRVSDLEARCEELEEELHQERETRAKEAAEDRKRIHDVETQVAEALDDASTATTNAPDPEGGSDGTTPAVDPPQTPLEDVIRVPEHLVEESLTANQRRARFVAKDVHEYTQSVPAGRAIRSSQLRQVLSAGEEVQIYTETVSRVIRFLDELGGDAVTVQESRRGERVVVFDDAFVERVQVYRHANKTNNTVVTGQGVEG